MSQKGFTDELTILLCEPELVNAEWKVPESDFAGAPQFQSAVFANVAQKVCEAGIAVGSNATLAIKLKDVSCAFLGFSSGETVTVQARALHVCDHCSLWRVNIANADSLTPVVEVTCVFESHHLDEDTTFDHPPIDGEPEVEPELSLSDRRRRQIFEGACEVISKKGYGDASIRAIAEAAELPASTMYEYIDSKEDILFMITSECMKELFRYFHEQLVSGGSARKRLNNAIGAYVRYIGKNRKYINLVYRETRALNKSNRQKIFDIEKEFMKLWEEIFSYGNETGEFRVANTDLTANMAYFFCTVWSLRYWSIGGYSEEEITESLINFIDSGVLATKLNIVSNDRRTP